MTVLRAKDIYRFYHAQQDEVLALRGINIEVDAGEMLVVVGPSGSGKSTLLSCLAGIDEPDGGYVEILGQRLTRRPEAERTSFRASAIGIMLQSGNLFEHLSVENNIRLQMYLAHKKDDYRLRYLLRMVGLDQRREALPSQLSGGEAARASLAVALANNPQLLLADEPTAEVDASTEQQLMDLLGNYLDQGGAAIIATHSPALSARAGHTVKLQDGKVIEYA